MHRATIAVTIVVSSAPLSAAAQMASGGVAVDRDSTAAFCCDEPHLGLTLVELGSALVLPWFYNRHAADDSTAVVGFAAWGNNIAAGFEWDGDNFQTNMFAHPYHGSLYFNAGRSNGYGFWESAVWSWAGSLLWELFGENNRPAINDWIATATGGVAIGEVLHRTAVVVRDNSATGTGRALREIGGFLLDPMGGASRLFRGEMARVGPNPPRRYPSSARSYVRLGYRTVGEGARAPSTSGPIVQIGLRYGDLFADHADPFDSFAVEVALHGRNEDFRLGGARLRGGLWGMPIATTRTLTHRFRLEQVFTYVNNRTVETGGSALAAAINSRFDLPGRWAMTTRIAPTALVIWGVDSEYADFTGREYDLGTGLGFDVGAFANFGDQPIFGAELALAVQRTLSGAPGMHTMQTLSLQANIPLYAGLGVAGDYRVFARRSEYVDLPDVTRRHGQAAVFLSWNRR
ncbi:MAG: DUF3943 domain-containing protein [Gemmatimonadota bacterium]|nr:DUF3943 domain-containing protein [Gemmatimonadota bacterium]